VSGDAEVKDSAILTAYGDALGKCVEGPREEFGERLVRMFLTSWDDPQLRPQLEGTFRSAFTSEEGAALLRRFLSNELFERVAEKLKLSPLTLDQAADILNVPPVHLNAAAAQVWGVILLRYILRIEPIASASEEELVALLSPTIQRYLGAELHLPNGANAD
jgi:Tetracyclin repressor-like, C-terminal domain